MITDTPPLGIPPAPGRNILVFRYLSLILIDKELY